VDDSNTTVMDLTTMLVRISDRARSADERELPAEYEALLNLCYEEQEVMKKFISSVKIERERKRPRRGTRYDEALRATRRLSEP
jgi:hypothetical protein